MDTSELHGDATLGGFVMGSVGGAVLPALTAAVGGEVVAATGLPAMVRMFWYQGGVAEWLLGSQF